MKLQFALAGLLTACLGGCTTQAPPPAPALGSDRDAHGCIATAGYSWCAGTNQCERPSELAQARGFEQTKDGFNTFCRNPPLKQ